MFTARREFLKQVAAVGALASAPSFSAAAEAEAPKSVAAQASKIKAVAFDAYGTLFDVHSVITLADKLFPDRGKELSQIWRTKQLEYTWLRTMSKQYVDFWQVTQDGLVFAAKRLGLELTADKREQLMNQYLKLDPFPENVGALKELKAMGLPLAILSNGSPKMLDAAVKSSGMEGVFNHVLSVDTLKTYKTDPRVYAMGPEAFKMQPGEICFVSSNSWDAVGATWAGLTTFWVNRAKAPAEELGVTPAKMGEKLTDVVEFVKVAKA
jgi:2-haloacid dehalogenase